MPKRTHPCGGAIFAKTIHASPARLAKSDFINLRLESEIALKLGRDMAASDAPWTAQSVVPFVAGAMPAYELIEDRNAVYTEANAVYVPAKSVKRDITSDRISL